MKQFKHKISGHIAKQSNSGENYKVSYPQNYTIPSWIIENSNDWEEITYPIGTKIKDSLTLSTYIKDESGKWIYSPINEYFLIDESEIGENKRFQVIDDFILPEKWGVRITKENRDVLTKWVESRPDYNKVHYKITPIDTFVVNKYCDNTYQHWYNSLPNEFIEITFEQFKKYVLKEDSKENLKQNSKDYEILSIINTKNNVIFKKCEDGLFSSCNCVKGSNSAEYYLSFNYFKIHSVLRVSDGEIFTLGDNCGGKFYNNRKITEINVEYNKLWVHQKEGKTSLKDIYHIKSAIFTTEDGKDYFEHTTLPYVDIIDFKISSCYTDSVFYKNNKNTIKLFSTREKAQEYVVLNKPCLSILDVISFNEYNPTETKTSFTNKLKKLVKSKL